MITPTSAKSKNYEALGIDEIANDIETVFNEVNSITTDGLPVVADGVTITGTGTTLDPLVAVGGGGGTTVEVNISSAQILAMGTTNVELLPAPGVGKYYDIERVVLEYTHVTTAYTFIPNLYFDTPYNPIRSTLITGTANKFVVYKDWENDLVASSSWGGNLTAPFPQSLEDYNYPFSITTDDSTDPTDGDGTLRAIITYTERTFGA